MHRVLVAGNLVWPHLHLQQEGACPCPQFSHRYFLGLVYHVIIWNE